MASLVVLGAIYLEDRDSSQGMKNPVAVQSTQAIRKEKLCTMKLAPWKFRKGCEILQPLRNFTGLRKCEIAFLATVPAAFNFLTFLSLFECFPKLSPCNSYCFGYFGIFVIGFGYKSPQTRHCKKVFLFY